MNSAVVLPRLNLETSKYHLMSYGNEYKVFLYEKNLIRRVNAIVKAYAPDTVFKNGDEAIITFSSNLLDLVVGALGIKGELRFEREAT